MRLNDKIPPLSHGFLCYNERVKQNAQKREIGEVCRIAVWLFLPGIRRIMAKCIVITSGKGGVGKTTVTANLGFRLASLGKRVCITDADFGLNNLDVVTGVENLVVYDVVDCIEGKCRAKQALIQSPVNKNLYILPAVHSFFKGEVSSENLKELIDGLSPSFDYILIDCPAGIDIGFRRAVSVCSEALVVTSSQLSSLRDADKVLAILRSFRLDYVGLIVNRVRGDLVADGVVLSPEEIAGVLKTDILGIIPDDDAVFLNNAGLLPSDSPAARAIKILASNLVNGKNRLYNYKADYVGFFGSIRRSLKRNL